VGGDALRHPVKVPREATELAWGVVRDTGREIARAETVEGARELLEGPEDRAEEPEREDEAEDKGEEDEEKRVKDGAGVAAEKGSEREMEGEDGAAGRGKPRLEHRGGRVRYEEADDGGEGARGPRKRTGRAGETDDAAFGAAEDDRAHLRVVEEDGGEVAFAHRIEGFATGDAGERADERRGVAVLGLGPPFESAPDHDETQGDQGDRGRKPGDGEETGAERKRSVPFPDLVARRGVAVSHARII